MRESWGADIIATDFESIGKSQEVSIWKKQKLATSLAMYSIESGMCVLMKWQSRDTLDWSFLSNLDARDSSSTHDGLIAKQSKAKQKQSRRSVLGALMGARTLARS